ncbi:MAG: tyrosine--tRNA ligase, partial [Erysipelotrichaceae bacterium]
MKDIFEDLKWRGLVKSCTDEEGMKNRLKTPIKVYCGFDPTADSMHIGNLQSIMLLRRFQDAGHIPVALAGGGTGMIGDPSGRKSERTFLDEQTIRNNTECIKNQLRNFIDFDNGAMMVNNLDWLSNISLISFLRDYGKSFSINYMMAKDSVTSRLEAGLSYTEFSYMLLQSIDYFYLNKNYGVEMQVGGSDQWGNITAGAELIRKISEDEIKVYGMTAPLITKADGSKFGKSVGGNIWLDANKTSPYAFYQFWLNTADTDVINFMKRLTLLERTEIEHYEQCIKEAPFKREAQKALATSITLLVHKEAGLESAQRISQALFGNALKTLSEEELKQALVDMETRSIETNITLTQALVDASIASSRRDARELIIGGSISINDEKINDPEMIIDDKQTIIDNRIVLRKGKKNYFILA